MTTIEQQVPKLGQVQAHTADLNVLTDAEFTLTQNSSLTLQPKKAINIQYNFVV